MRLGRLLAIRPGEGALVASLAALFAVIEAGRGLAEVGADALVISRFGAGVLPYLYIALGSLGMVVALAYGAGLGRLARRPFFGGLLVAFAAILAAERLALAAGADAAVLVVYVSLLVMTALLTTIVWTVAAGTLDARQAKRLFPLCTGAAIAGNFAGTLLAGQVARLAGSENLVTAYAMTVLAGAGLVMFVTGRFGRTGEARQDGAGRLGGGSRRSIVGELRAGLDYVRESPLMRLVAIAYVLFAVLLFSANVPYLQAFETAYEGRPVELATALGLVSAGVTATSFVVSMLLANRIYARFGVVTAALLLPLVYLAGFGLWIVQFNLATAIAFRFTHQVTQRSVSNAAWSAVYAVLPQERRPQVMAFIDGVPGQVGTILSGVLLLVVATVLEPAQIFLVGAVAAAICAWVVLRIRRRYGEALVRTLRSGLGEQVLEGGPGLAALRHDSKVVGELVSALGDAQPGTRRLAAELLGRLGDPAAVDGLAVASGDPDPDVRVAAIAALRTLDPDRAAQAVGQGALRDPIAAVRIAAVRTIAPQNLSVEDHAALANDPEPAVRAAVALACAANGAGDEAIEIVDSLLRDERSDARAAGLSAVRERPADLADIGRVEATLGDASADVRAAATEALAAMLAGSNGSGAAPRVVSPRLLAALDDEALVVRRAAGRALRTLAAGAAGEPAGNVRAAMVGVLEAGPDRARDGALTALHGVTGRDAARVRDWAIGQAERAVALREQASTIHAATAGGPDSPARYLADVIDKRRRVIEGRLLVAIAALGFPEADGPIRRSLASRDPETRAQAIEAVDAIGDRSLGKAVVRLLDTDPGSDAAAARVDGASLARVLDGLSEDPDPWIRRLAMRAIAGRLASQWQALGARAAGDPDPIVQAALADSAEHGGPAMPETAPTLGELDRMMFLRRVPLFGDLAPEDLQRLAAVATERLYEPGETLVREGDPGEELTVIVDGDVRVIRGEGPDARLIRSYAAGDHVGELAVLRRQPRSATVVAGSEGVRGLVISGEGLRAILAERPEAAMAMLATLAERISQE